MGVYSEILMTIEELHAENRSSADIAKAVNAEYKIAMTEANVEEIIQEWQVDWRAEEKKYERLSDFYEGAL